ncbi:cell division protein ZipA C-terminal FtsZ-binding domain-containing protein [Methylicorpusculum oleiharenae]|uniref:cell division protein ZipA C-terminal FtsZ-binding domain-containing protein n=1 Tax=Methylicorpusculum oleiharenae TaxID=1338687 RepID=UPI00135B53A3|nr:cell division protein ZipA C-terminal FtsZ-binding domain-containing protein [Methylicorpusculum oleiharenae]MCD2452983.1 cell division protein ZipA C-terminal FtsZ-binding domain-containing protein [Methylicorpusculum oleiharenae]
MDKEILRIVIIAAGLGVMLCLVLWSYWKKGSLPGRSSLSGRFKNPIGRIDESLVLHPENDEFDVVPLGGALDEDNDYEYAQSLYGQEEHEAFGSSTQQRHHDERPSSHDEQSRELPKLIQYSLVAVADEGFNGEDIDRAFNIAGLKYGSLKIYERIDGNGLVDFGVASMVEPGTFPDKNIREFNCPGLVFFMQPREVDDPVSVYDDFVETIDILAAELDGVKWDNQRQPLTGSAIHEMRNRLASGYQ